jgi:hypothetical protein
MDQPNKVFHCFFVANFSITKSFGSSSWAMQSTPFSQSTSSVTSSVSWVVKPESDMSVSVVHNFVIHILTSFISQYNESNVMHF